MTSIAQPLPRPPASKEAPNNVSTAMHARCIINMPLIKHIITVFFTEMVDHKLARTHVAPEPSLGNATRKINGATHSSPVIPKATTQKVLPTPVHSSLKREPSCITLTNYRWYNLYASQPKQHTHAHAHITTHCCSFGAAFASLSVEVVKMRDDFSWNNIYNKKRAC